MNFKNKKCYACDRNSSSKEHVPPKSVFPEDHEHNLDLSLRNNLITVPSCHLHNSKKALDDEVFKCLVHFVFGESELSLEQINTKDSRLNRTLWGDNGKAGIVLDRLEPAITEDGSPTLAFPKEVVDVVIDSFHMIAKGLYYHLNKCTRRFKGRIEVIHRHFRITKNGVTRPQVDNIPRIQDLTEKDGVVIGGSNPSVFRYRRFTREDLIVFGLEFWEGEPILIFMFDAAKKRNKRKKTAQVKKKRK